MIPYRQKFRFQNKKGSISYERRVYESIEDRSLPVLGYISKIDEKQSLGSKGITKGDLPIKNGQILPFLVL